MIGRILPLLPREGPSGARREEGLYLRAALRLAVKDPGAASAAREYLEKYPASPLSAGIGVRLGHEALLAGDTAAAISRYRAASDSGNPDASAVARYMLAWIRFQSGDADGALRELSQPLSDPSFPCGDPSPFERAVVSLSIRAWRESPLERLDSYSPVKAGTCGGKVLLTALLEAEEKRGEAGRAAEVRDVAARRFPSDENSAALEMETVESLLRVGREREALNRALTLRGKYGPDSAWAQSQPAPVGEKTAKELAEMFRTLAGKKFDEGIRSGERSALSSSAALMGEYFQMKGEDPSDEDGELRLKWAIALLGSGDREGGVLLLEELVGEQRGDATGERAAVLYAETMIAGYERKETSAEDAEDASLLLLEEHPSEKSVSLALRASGAFLSAREYGRALRTSEQVEGSRSATPAQAAQARLIQAEAAVFEGEAAAAREKAALALADTGGGATAGARAKDLYLLSSLKEAGGKETAGDPLGAAAVLEEVSVRFPGAPEVPIYLLRAMRLYAKGGDAEGAIRSGLRFRKDFPRREEAAEVASVVGPLLEEKKEFAEAGELYEAVAERFPKGEAAPRFLFHAARLAEEHGPPEAAEKRFNAYRARYANPRWKWTYATLYMGLAGWRRGETKASIRLLEEGLRKADAGMEEEAPGEFAELAGKARIAVGENWAEQFRKTRLLVPLDKSLAIKDRFFRRALGAFEKVESEAPLEVALQASLLSGDLLVEYGKAILASQRPKGLKGERPRRIRRGVAGSGEIVLRTVPRPVRRRAGPARGRGGARGPRGSDPEAAGDRAGAPGGDDVSEGREESMRRAAAFLAICILAAAPGFAAEKPAAGGGSHSLRMEELEVRGLREKPGVLYLPVHHGITIPSPVRYDLFLRTWRGRFFPGRSPWKLRRPVESRNKERPLTDETRKIRVSVVPMPPKTVEETGLSLGFLVELACKTLYFGGVMSLSSISEQLGASRQRIERRDGFPEKGAAGRGEEGRGHPRRIHVRPHRPRTGEGEGVPPALRVLRRGPRHARAIHGGGEETDGPEDVGQSRVDGPRLRGGHPDPRPAGTPGPRGQLRPLHLPLRPLRERQDVHRRAAGEGPERERLHPPRALRGQPGHPRVRPGEPLPRRSRRADGPGPGRPHRTGGVRPPLGPVRTPGDRLRRGADAGDARPELRRDRQVLRGAPPAESQRGGLPRSTTSAGSWSAPSIFSIAGSSPSRRRATT